MIIEVNVNTTLDPGFNNYLVDAGSSNIVLTLPLITGEGTTFTITRKDTNATNTVTINPTGPDTINNTSSYFLPFLNLGLNNPSKFSITIIALGTNWIIVNALNGLTGSLGNQGFTGLPGITGFQGITGLQGLTGIAGPTGVLGATGPIGNTGLIGLTGFTGLTGFRGPTGLAGFTGNTGAIGVSGATGLRGATGLIGFTGVIGNTGPSLDGNTGFNGLTGAFGALGPVTGDWFNNSFLGLWGPGSTSFGGTLGLQRVFTGSAFVNPVAASPFSETARRYAVASALPNPNAFAAQYSNISQYWRGNAAGLGGFDLEWIFMINPRNTANGFFLGLSVTGTPINSATVSTFFNIIGVGLDAGDTQFSIMHNDGTGAATKVNTTFTYDSASLYRLRLFCAPNTATVSWEFDDIKIASVNGNIAANFPTSTTLLTPLVYVNNGAIASNIVARYTTLYIKRGIN